MELAVRQVAFFDLDGAFCRSLGSPYVLFVLLYVRAVPQPLEVPGG